MDVRHNSILQIHKLLVDMAYQHSDIDYDVTMLKSDVIDV